MALVCSALPLAAREKFHACAYAGTYTSAEKQFLATHYNLIALDNPTRPGDYKAYNPSLKVLVYRALVCEFDWMTDFFGNSEWDMVNPHEDWFIHDPTTGKRLQSTDGYPWYLMDPGNPGWQAHLARILQDFKDAGCDGFFGDNGFWSLFNMWFVTIKAEPAVTIGDGRTVRTANGNGIYGVVGVYTNSSGTGTNYFSGGSYSEDTITLGAAPGPVGTRVYLTYYANAYHYRQPAVVAAGGTTLSVPAKANWVYGVYDNSALSGTNYYTGNGSNYFTLSGDTTIITLGRPATAGRTMYVKYRADMAPADNIRTWHSDMVSLMSAVKGALGPDFMCFYNGVVRRDSDEPYLDYFDGGMMEQFITVSGDSPLYYDGYTRWLEEQQRVDSVVAHHPDKWLMVQSGVSRDAGYSTDLKNKWAMFCFASYLLCRGDNTSFNFTKTGYNGLDFYPYWSLDYGTPTGPRRTVSVSANLQGQGIYQRDFTKCKVLVNPTGSQGSTPTSADVTVTVPLDAAYRLLNMDGTISATPITSISLPPRTGAILFRSSDLPGGQAPPAPAITSPSNGSAVASRTATITGTETDATARITVTVGSTTYGPVSVSGGVWSVPVNLAEGANRVTARATNSYGSADSAAITVTADTAKPTVSITSPAAGALVQGTVTVGATASDPAPSSGLTVEFYLDGQLKASNTASPYTWSWNTAGLSGTHSLTARAVDKAGNATTSTAVSVTINGSVPSTLQVGFTSPADGSTISGVVTIEVTASGLASGTGTAKLYLDGSLASTVTGTPPFRWTWNAGTGPATRTLRAEVTDTAGGSGSASCTVTVGSSTTTRPATPVITSPANGSRLSSTSVTVSGTEATAGATVSVRVNNSTQVRDLPVSGGVWSARVTLAPGANSIAAYATNAAGNSALSATVSVSVGSGAPTVQIVSPSAATVSGTVLLDVVASTTGTARVYVNGSLAATQAGGPEWRWNWGVGTTPRQINLRVTVTDSAGNTGETSKTVTVG